MLNGENTDYGALYEAASMQITMVNVLFVW